MFTHPNQIDATADTDVAEPEDGLTMPWRPIVRGALLSLPFWLALGWLVFL